MIRVKVVKGMGVVWITSSDGGQVVELTRAEVDEWVEELITLRDDMDKAGPHVAWPAPDYS